MPRQVDDYSDERNKAWCIHCGNGLSESPQTRDHTPTKALLDRPLPNDLTKTPVCLPCNNGFSLDEEYFATLISAILSGTTDPDKQVIEHAGRTLAHSEALRTLIRSQMVEEVDLLGDRQIRWNPDMNRVRNVVVKNARAHLFFENGEPMLEEPEAIVIRPLAAMARVEVSDFFSGNLIQPWCEVGSRWNTRLVEGDHFDSDGFLVVQPGVYRFRIEDGGLGVRSVIREYLTASVSW